MPVPVQWLAEIFPATHYIRITRAIYLRGAGPLDLLPEIALLALFGALLLRKALTSVEARA
jgi:ABC-2 type transport system permease protein